MSLEAIALLRIPYAEICTAHDLEPAASAAQALEELSTFVPIGSDGTACVLDLALGSPPEELAEALWNFVGEKLEDHSDERGVLVVADKGFGDADLSSYDAAVKFFGEAGQWIEPIIGDDASGDASARMQAMLGGDMAGTISQIQSQLSADPRMAAALGQAGGGGDLLAMAQQMLSQMSPAQQAQLEQMAKSMFGNLDPSALAGMVPGGGATLAAAADDAAADDDDPEFGGPESSDARGSEKSSGPAAPAGSKKK